MLTVCLESDGRPPRGGARSVQSDVCMETLRTGRAGGDSQYTEKPEISMLPRGNGDQKRDLEAFVRGWVGRDGGDVPIERQA